MASRQSTAGAAPRPAAASRRTYSATPSRSGRKSTKTSWPSADLVQTPEMHPGNALLEALHPRIACHKFNEVDNVTPMSLPSQRLLTAGLGQVLQGSFRELILTATLVPQHDLNKHTESMMCCCCCSVIFLRTALGSAAVPQPAINVGGAFEVAADAALGATLKPGFLPYRVPSLPCTQTCRRLCSGPSAHSDINLALRRATWSSCTAPSSSKTSE